MRKKDKCKHFTGMQNEVCKAGIRYETMTPLPCISKYARPEGPLCDKYEEPSDFEIAEDEAKLQASLERHRKAGPVLMELRKKYKGQSWVGVIDCPVCAGKLHISISGYNGHMHGRCETENCLCWME